MGANLRHATFEAARLQHKRLAGTLEYWAAVCGTTPPWKDVIMWVGSAGGVSRHWA